LVVKSRVRRLADDDTGKLASQGRQMKGYIRGRESMNKPIGVMNGERAARGEAKNN
jgi:hypothetical protein